MTNKAPFCAFLWLTITVLHRQIRSLPTYQVGPRNLFTPLETCLLFLMGRNLWLINDLRLRKITYEKINLFMQNKPNFRKSQMNVTFFITRDYDKLDTWSSGKNKANTKPIQSRYKANTKPIQSQYKANTKPIQSQYKANTKPIQSQYKPNSNPNKPNSCPPSVWRDKPNPAPILGGDCPMVLERLYATGYSKSNRWSNLRIGAGQKWSIST